MTEAIRNGLYSITTTLLDGVHGGQTGVSVLRNGTMLGGGSVLYHFGSYHCSGGKWKGEVTSQEHSPTIDVRPFAGYIASMGFAGTYTDDGAEFEATALVGKRSIRLKTMFRLLIADRENSPPPSGYDSCTAKARNSPHVSSWPLRIARKNMRRLRQRTMICEFASPSHAMLSR